MGEGNIQLGILGVDILVGWEWGWLSECTGLGLGRMSGFILSFG